MLAIFVPAAALLAVILHLQLFPRGFIFAPLIAVAALVVHPSIFCIAGYLCFAILLYDSHRRLGAKVFQHPFPPVFVLLLFLVMGVIYHRADLGWLSAPIALLLAPGGMLGIFAWGFYEEAEAALPKQQPLDQVLSTYPRRDGYFIGYRQGYPVFLPRSVFRRNGIITGAPGSGKSNVALTTLLVQKIREGSEPILVIDLKGDAATFNVVSGESGNRFIGFTLDSGKRTTTIDLMDEVTRLYPENFERASFLCKCLGMSYGSDQYAVKYFGAEGHKIIHRGYDAATTKKRLQHLQDLYFSTRQLQLDNPMEYKDSTQAVTDLDMLRRIPQLYPSSRQLDFKAAFRDRQVVYCSLRAGLSPKVAGDVARIITNIWARYASRFQVPCSCFVDEAQHWIGDTAATDFEQGRGFGLSHIIAMQDVEQAKPLRGRNLGDIVRSLAGFSMTFTVPSSDAAREHVLMSGEKPKVMETHSRSESRKWWSIFEGSTSEGTNTREIMEPVLDVNAVLEASARQGAFLYREHGAVTIVDGIHPFTQEEYARRNSIPWPNGAMLQTPKLDEPQRTKKPPQPGDGKPETTQEAINKLKRRKKKGGGDKTQ